MKVFAKSLIFTGFAVWILSCSAAAPKSSAPAQPSFDSRFNQLQLNMSNDEVSKLLGQPDLKEAKLNGGITQETWHYRGGPCAGAESSSYKSCERYVHFDNGKLTAYGADTPPAAPAGAGANLAVDGSLGIGQDCRLDRECRSQNCHFHRCSGKDNCSVIEGGRCAIDADCCTHFCDFGTCRKKL